MNLFRRITATFSGTIDSAVAQLENHEAVVHAALKDTRVMAAKAKVRLARVQEDGRTLEQKLEKVTLAEQTWANRAVELAEGEESKALECMRRRNQSREQIISISNALQQHKLQEQNLTEAVVRIEARLKEIESTKNLLRTRQSTAEAQRAVGRLEAGSSMDLDDVLERWEMRILETEYANPLDSSTDTFEKKFEEQENNDELKAQLQELKAREK